MIELKMDCATNEIGWDRFCTERPPFSIAIDGYVPEQPRFNPVGPHLNLNHHEQVSRLETRATCAQAAIHVEQGLFQLFRDKAGAPCALVWANDCDQDVCFTWAVLSRPQLLQSEEFQRLLRIVELRDTTGGFCALPADPADAEALAWIFEPYQEFRGSGKMAERNDVAFTHIVTDALSRIDRCAHGRGEKRGLELDYEVMWTGNGWKMVAERSTDARMAMHSDGIRAFVASRERNDGGWQYTIGRASPLIPFPIPQILDRFRAAERDPKHTWGGSEIIGGCNRVHGSSLTPPEVAALIDCD